MTEQSNQENAKAILTFAIQLLETTPFTLQQHQDVVTVINFLGSLLSQLEPSPPPLSQKDLFEPAKESK